MIQNASKSPDPLTELILTTFRFNGALLAAGDALVGDLGLTSARWQVMGALALEGRPLSVAQAARRMGLTRQAVQRTTNDLVADGLVTFADNPDHKRARHVVLTAKGQRAYAAADTRQRQWVGELGDGLEPAEIARASALMQRLLERLQGNQETNHDSKGG